MVIGAQRLIERDIRRRKPGSIVLPTDFRGKATGDAIRRAMSRLTRSGKLRRIGHGIYYVPNIDPVLGDLYPSPTEVVKLIAKRDKIKLRTTGAYALHRLGLSTQVPMNLVYLTDGSPRRFQVGKMKVVFQSAPPKFMALSGEVSGLVIQAIDELGVENITKQIRKRLVDFLAKEDPRKLQHDLTLAPVKIHDLIIAMMREKSVA